jgi:hypothetical protein
LGAQRRGDFRAQAIVVIHNCDFGPNNSLGDGRSPAGGHKGGCAI